MKHFRADGRRDLTRKHPFGVVHERVVHEGSSGGGVVAAQPVLGNQRVEAVVEVRGLVQREAAVLDWAVAGVRQEVDVGIGRVLWLLAIVEPGDAGLRVPVHAEWEAPVVVLHSIVQEDDPGWDCRRRRWVKISRGD